MPDPPGSPLSRGRTVCGRRFKFQTANAPPPLFFAARGTPSSLFFLPAKSRGEALFALGIFSRPGLTATAEIFGQVEFKDTENFSDTERLTEELLKRLILEGLPTEAASDKHVGELYHTWQMPMYNLDFTRIDIPLADLEAERDALMWAEAGYSPYDH